MSQRTLIGTFFAAVFVLAIGLLWRDAEAPPRSVDAAPPPSRAETPTAVATEDSEIPEVAAPAADSLDMADLPAPARAMLEADPDLADRMRQDRYAAAADARWSDAVDQAGYTADDLDPAVRKAFGSAGLEPRYAPDGAIEGLMIKELPDSHPFARAGLARGDWISRIQGVPLEDPAELPSLLVRLGPRFEICSRHGGQGAERCEEVELE